MERKIAIIVNSRTDYEYFLSSREYAAIQNQVIIDISDDTTYEKTAVEMAQQGVRAIICKSFPSVRIHTAIQDSIPVFSIAPSRVDILFALMQADRRHKKKIYLLLARTTEFDISTYRDFFDTPITCYFHSGRSDLNDYVQSIPDAADAVFIGASLVQKLLRLYHPNAEQIFLYLSPSRVKESFDVAQQLLSRADVLERSRNLLRTVMDKTDDNVLLVDRALHLQMMSNLSKLLPQARSQEALIGKPLTEVFPMLCNVAAQLFLHVEKRMEPQIVSIGRHQYSVEISYLTKENVPEQAVLILKDITKLQRLEQSVRQQLNQQGLVATYRFENILTADARMKETINLAKRYAVTRSPILIYGQSGTGKELFAQSIVSASRRKSRPFVAINCAALSESLLESELFGYVDGAFTGARRGGKAGLFELAHTGTIFLDEINSMSLNLQSKILRVIEQKEVMRVGSDRVIPLDIRIISATNSDLMKMIENETFRRDLFYRLNVLDLHLPPLDERPNDILYLFAHFICQQTGELEASFQLSKELQQALLAHEWRGNIRELRNTAEKYLIVGEKSLISELAPRPAAAIRTDDGPQKEQAALPDAGAVQIDLRGLGNAVEKLVIESLLAQGLSKGDTARMLGISRTALFKKIEKFREK